ncbi:carboxymuconolactone decarboxylase family protein [Deminuibacter soli]|uniref:Carboxymuconolactone decarboxylase family protein n=1 Tax=Deminuibacter soli TaxID=2291815 RepID=A0A3E1NEU2_9BACT|nr:carboxymuconolactone decarboxylase family protein [Deminuibacter soli]RFM26382.1 carboxymuconolactone decarboxylase family protein [Deminuibacter soli]
MQERFLLARTQPAAFAAMLQLDNYVAGTAIPLLHRELIKIRASQLNGCAFCTDKHIQHALQLGETPERIVLLPAWREAPHFTHAERIILSMTEEITLIHHSGLSDATWQQAICTFGDTLTAQLVMAITVINSWNRVGIASGRIPV